MKKMKVQVCTGTTCFVMGGADLLLLEDVVIDRWGQYGVTSEVFNEKVDFSGLPCSDACHEPSQKPPFVIMDGTLIAEATIGKVLEQLEPHFFPKENNEEIGRE